jgi:BirA family biotin operon repressor/biotin-[acetyl-CoA-carboxylase] ligase
VDKVPIVAFGEIDSTNAEAKRRGEVGDSGPMWITATRQSAGRGRRGRNWETEAGNLAATYFFTTNQSAAEVAQHSFVAALAVADLASAYVPTSLVSVKWPNDVLIAGRKTAGILIESSTRPGGGLWVAVGIGVNLAHPPTEAAYPATAFSEHMTAPPPPPLDALEKLSEAFERWRLLWRRAGFAPIAEAWTKRAHGLGETCTARLPNETVEGIAEGIDEDGALRLRVAAGRVRLITAGDVFFGGA